MDYKRLIHKNRLSFLVKYAFLVGCVLLFVACEEGTTTNHFLTTTINGGGAATFDQSLNTTDNVTFANVTADFYFGDGSQLTNLPSSGFTNGSTIEVNDLYVQDDVFISDKVYLEDNVGFQTFIIEYIDDGFVTNNELRFTPPIGSPFYYYANDEQLLTNLGYCSGSSYATRTCGTVPQFLDDNPEPADVVWTDLTDQGTFTNEKYCTYNSTTGYINCNSEGGGGIQNDSIAKVRKLGIMTAPSYAFEIKNTTFSDLYAANIEITQTGTNSAPLRFKNTVNTASGNPNSFVLYGELTSNKDLAGIQTLKGFNMKIGESIATQTQGTRNMNAIDIDSSSGFMTGGTTTTIGYEYTNAGGFLTAGTLNQYGAKLTKTDHTDVGTGTINTYGIYLDNWDAGASDDLSYSIWVDEGDAVFRDKVCLESTCTYYLEYNGTCIYSSGSGNCV